MPVWDDVNARARGLATHLLTRPRLEQLAEADDVATLARVLEGPGLTLEDAGPVLPTAEGLDLAIGRSVGRRFHLLARWLGPGRRGVVAVIYEDEERRAIRALLRGAAAGVSPGGRLRGINPTPGLSARQLNRLAAADSVGDLTSRLITMGHPAGRALQLSLHDDRGRLGLAASELALARLFALRVRRLARRSGRLMRVFVGSLLDLENAGALLLRGDWGPGLGPERVMLPGGLVLTAAEMKRLADEPGERFKGMLARAFRGTPLHPAFATGDDRRTLESRGLAVLIRWLRDLARRDPLSPAPLLGTLLRIRAEARDLRSIVWGVSLGGSAGLIAAELVTP
jgi:vacuolar-type H+-ATPase subunit C/Vma6